SLAGWNEIDDEGVYRFVGALAVAVVLVTVLQPILRRTAGRPARAAGTDNAFAFTCTLDDGREVRRDDEAPNFAAAVAAAINELERDGGRVMKIERS
ncbi:MAG TPA: hypothetical protein VG144_05930, partial [Gaiellaceae bacterium]|nr:hypothetical protein [Gaiellaceae bacterium]